MSDADLILVEKTKKGDNRAFEILVRRYQGRLASVISRFVSDHARVQDLTQESFIKAYRAIHSFRGDSAFFTWLYRIAVNTVKNHLMANGRHVPLSDVELSEVEDLAPQLRNSDTPERQMLRSELLENLRKAIDQLAPEMRKAIHLRDIEGLSYEEIAAVMECPIGTVRSRIFRGRQEIANQLRDFL
ncbi:MAG: RNA polymerase sigma factor RpoE [Magnetococcales bacterium]|nr:RNA polymerase sigma factor RpoE [Magnetococcales bacterium]MBF0156105.1 RNA polymerase sigma factor RpoE [Magnetococcales bacterium]